jgi:hypothetical protein
MRFFDPTIWGEAEATVIDVSASFFDVIVVDIHGPFRWRCAERAADHLAAGGMIIVDNSDQCLRTTAILRDRGLGKIDFTGFAPRGVYAQSTTLFFRERIGLPLRSGEAPAKGVAQPNPPWENCRLMNLFHDNTVTPGCPVFIGGY